MRLPFVGTCAELLSNHWTKTGAFTRPGIDDGLRSEYRPLAPRDGPLGGGSATRGLYHVSVSNVAALQSGGSGRTRRCGTGAR